ncbi:MAG: transcription-repair-coupling factor [Candidatus Binatia bacterium]|nr:MAG: transcription-repair-coupling factor [Candidatus Binatia bacterium]
MHLGQELGRAFRSQREAAPLRIQGLTGSASAYCLFRLLSAEPRPGLVVLPTPAEAERMFADLRFFFEETDDTPLERRRIWLLPPWDVPPFEDCSPSPDAAMLRVQALFGLVRTPTPLVVAPAEAVLQRVPPPDVFGREWLRLEAGQEVDLETVAAKLVDWGYRRLALVEERGEFRVRGGILDVYPAGSAHPVRLELSGDVIERISAFDVGSQRSCGPLREVLLLPAREFSLSAQRGCVARVAERCRELELRREDRLEIEQALREGLWVPGIEFFLPYFYPELVPVSAYLPESALLWTEDPLGVEGALAAAERAIARRAAEREAERKFLPPPGLLFLAADEWEDATRRFLRVESGGLALSSPESGPVLEVRCAGTRDLRLERHPGEPSFAAVAERLDRWCREGERVFVVTTSESQARRVSALLEAHGVVPSLPKEPIGAVLGAPAAGRPRILVGELGSGFRLADERLVFVTEADLFAEPRPRRRSHRPRVGELLRDLGELRRDDVVVHVDHGIGLYRGLKHLRVAGTEGDYLHLEYAGGDRLYVPVDRINLVRKYVGTDGTAPPLDRLGSPSWERTKKKVRESVLAMAKELVEIYAAREVLEREPYAPPDDLYREFEASFPYEETPDQLRAIEETVADLLRPKPMDRLVCGDVGFGKTEVALRAALLAVLDGRQVAVLVPTTVLAQQHLRTFRSRLEPYPVRVEMLSRFVPREKTREILEGLAAGTVDIVIGTHRLLRPDVRFRKLGLLVVDEEHRFGVRHKEQLKKMRRLVDVLTLTATPIPRTLQMSLSGIRDLSVIETPPVDRQAVRTYVTRYDESLLREAILRELSRGGQVFFVQNRVENIEVMAARLRELVPEARVAVAHGQMPSGALEKVMLEFVEGRVDVLVCTAIVESGLDIPNANTMIVHGADRFGLAELYQLRGRVGRSHQRAYCYLVVPGEHLITKEAQKRLQVLQELDELGGGFRLAVHDLEIRGAGNLLGKQQSGQIAAVGFDLYEKMLAEAVRELRGLPPEPDVEPEIQLGIPAFLPESYVPDEHQRLVFYRRLASAEEPEQLDAVLEELRDRYGPPPAIVENLVVLMRLRQRLRARRVLRAVRRGTWVLLHFHPEADVDVERVAALVRSESGRFRLGGDYQLAFRVDDPEPVALSREVESVLGRI